MAEEEKVLEEEVAEEAVETTEEDKEAELLEKLKESEDKYLRLYAEYENYKKRTLKEKDARYADAVISRFAVCMKYAPS